MVETHKARRRKGVVAISAITAVALALAGCSAGGGANSNRATPSKLSESATDFLAKEAKALGVSSISVLALASPQANGVRDVSEQFTQATGITVNWTLLDEQSVETKAAVALASGNGAYDVLQTPSTLIPSYSDRGWLASISDLAANKKLQVPGWNKHDYGDVANELLTHDGELYGVPMFIGAQIYWYRTDLFKEAGITSTPKTYKELIADAKKLNSSSVAGIALRSAPSTSQLLFDWSAWLYAYGGKYYESYKDGKYSQPALDSPEAVRALQDYSDLLKNDAPNGATNWSAPDITRAFAAGRVAIVQEGAVFGGLFNDPARSQVAGKVGTFTMPSGPGGSYIPFDTHGWAIAGNSKAQEAAWLFVQWATLTQTLTAATQTASGFATPPLTDVYNSKAYKQTYGFSNYVDSVTKTIGLANNGHVSPLKGDPHYEPGSTDWATNGARIAQELSKAVTGQESVEQAIKTAASYLE
jgi:ABC-type glycerol-3-phosphate transport system substrate-binding protein